MKKLFIVLIVAIALIGCTEVVKKEKTGFQKVKCVFLTSC